VRELKNSTSYLFTVGLLWNPNVLYLSHKIPSLDPTLSQINSFHNFTLCFLIFVVILCRLHFCLPDGFPHEVLSAFFIYPCMPYFRPFARTPPPPPQILSEQYTRKFKSPVDSSALVSNCFLCVMVWKTLNLYLSLKVIHSVSRYS
jgi:hypothetical protein